MYSKSSVRSNIVCYEYRHVRWEGLSVLQLSAHEEFLKSLHTELQ